MSSLEVVRHYYDCFNQQNWEGMLACLAPDIRHEVNQGGVRIGLDLYRAFLQHMDDCYVETLTNMVFLSDESGERIATEFVVNGLYKKTDGEGVPEARNQRYVLPAGAFLEVRDGKIHRVTTYYNLPEWIRQVS